MTVANNSLQYLVLTLGDARAVTQSIPKTLNPEWNTIEEFPVNSTNSLILDVICWDKDRFGKDYLGEFDLALEEIFQNEQTSQEPKWYPLKSKRPGKKTSVVSGEVQLQFTLYDATNTSATPQQVMDKFAALNSAVPVASNTPSMTPTTSPGGAIPRSVPGATPPIDEEDEDLLDELDEDTSDEVDDPTKPETAEKRRRRLRIKGLRRKKRQNPYAFTNGESDLVGIIYLEVVKITDLPPEHNFTRTSFDMDPFVVISLGKKTYRTRHVRHDLNPVYNEKMIFHVEGSEQKYSFAFTVIDRDKYSGNDFIASCSLPVQQLIERAPRANHETGLYDLREPPEYIKVASKGRFKKLGMSRTSSSQSLSKMIRPGLSKNPSSMSTNSVKEASIVDPSQGIKSALLAPADALANTGIEIPTEQAQMDADDPDFNDFVIPLKMKNLEKWEDKHNPQLFLKAKYMPYAALRQQFWRAMLKQYDTDESGNINRIEMTTMLDSLGSTLKETTIDSFFQRFPHKAADNEEIWELTMDEAVICLEDQLEAKSRTPNMGEKVKNLVPGMKNLLNIPSKRNDQESESGSGTSTPHIMLDTENSEAPTLNPSEPTTTGDDSDSADKDDSNDEHVVEIRECPICHQPRLNKRKDTDIITHIATCASSDWRQVNNVMMSGFVTASQAQRKWYSKVITKISYGGYKLGANSANILVQDRLTGQINEEKMSVYVRLGIRMLYKGLKSREMETKRSKSCSP
jgi:phosphatidylserine decarboxylase